MKNLINSYFLDWKNSIHVFRCGYYGRRMWILRDKKRKFSCLIYAHSQFLCSFTSFKLSTLGICHPSRIYLPCSTAIRRDIHEAWCFRSYELWCRTVARKSSIGGLYVRAGEGWHSNLTEIPLTYSVSYFNLGAWSFFGGATPTKAPRGDGTAVVSWRWVCFTTLL